MQYNSLNQYHNIEHRDTIILNSKYVIEMVGDQINNQEIIEQLHLQSDQNEMTKLLEYLANELIIS